jgi:hypothetical protein
MNTRKCRFYCCARSQILHTDRRLPGCANSETPLLMLRTIGKPTYRTINNQYATHCMPGYRLPGYAHREMFRSCCALLEMLPTACPEVPLTTRLTVNTRATKTRKCHFPMLRKIGNAAHRMPDNASRVVQTRKCRYSCCALSEMLPRAWPEIPPIACLPIKPLVMYTQKVRFRCCARSYLLSPAFTSQAVHTRKRRCSCCPHSEMLPTPCPDHRP